MRYIFYKVDSVDCVLEVEDSTMRLTSSRICLSGVHFDPLKPALPSLKKKIFSCFSELEFLLIGRWVLVPNFSFLGIWALIV